MSQHDKRQTDLNIAFARSDWKDKDMSEPTPIDTGDIMRDGIINMPFDMAMGNVISQHQFYQTAQQTLRELAAKIAEVERLKAEHEVEQPYRTYQYWKDKAGQAEAEKEALRVDAERYRWLADSNNYEKSVELISANLTEYQLDAAIDEAREVKP